MFDISAECNFCVCNMHGSMHSRAMGIMTRFTGVRSNFFLKGITSFETRYRPILFGSTVTRAIPMSSFENAINAHT